jgi:DNA-directed RNA polymerase specialized sigma24 family protein
MTPPHQSSDPDREFSDVKIAQRLKLFNEFYEDLLSPYSATTRSSTFPFIRSKLIQFRLWPDYNEVTILQEVYIRTIEKILKGSTITNPSSWVCSVAFRYIRELSRCRVRYTHVDGQFLDLLSSEEGVSSEIITDEMVKVGQAFQALSPKEKLLLTHKIVLNESWTEIQDFLEQEGYGRCELPALRKQKERALLRLRSIYHALCAN